MIDGRCLPEDWKKNFRMSNDSFMKLVDELRPFISPNPRSPRPGISAEKKVCHEGHSSWLILLLEMRLLV